MAWAPDDTLQRFNHKNPGLEPPLQRVPFADGAHLMANLVKASQNDMISGRDFPAGIAGRRIEQALKIAMIRAVSRDAAAPAVTAEDIQYGDMLASISIHTLGEGL